MSKDMRRRVSEMETMLLQDEEWDLDVDAICAEFSDDPSSDYYDYYRPQTQPEPVAPAYEEEPEALYVADKKARKAMKKEEKAARKARGQKGIGGLVFLALLEVLGILGVLAWWLRWFL